MFENPSNFVATVLSSSLALGRSRVSTVALAASIVMTSTAFASAFYQSQPLGLQDPQAPGKHSKFKAGIVNADGSINIGMGFSVSHDGTGEYTLDVPAGNFKICPAILVTPWGSNGETPIAYDFDYVTCGNSGEVKMQIVIRGRKSGALQDNAYHFVLIEP